MEDQVPKEQVKQGFDRLLKTVQDTARSQVAKYEGRVMEALIEEITEKGNSVEKSQPTENGEVMEKEHSGGESVSMVTGRLSNNTIVHVPGDASLIGKTVKVSLDECHGFYYIGHCV